MPQFSNHPPIDPRGHGLTLMRTPANGKLLLAVTCHDLVGCPTHWFNGRTVPCEADDCEACKEGISWRWHAYLSGLLGTSRNHVLAEFTAQAAERITQYRDTQQTLRGAILTAHRHHNRHNGRVIIHMQPGDLARLNLPTPPDLINVLSILWNIPNPNLTAARHLRNMPAITNKQPPSGNHPTRVTPATPPT